MGCYQIKIGNKQRKQKLPSEFATELLNNLDKLVNTSRERTDFKPASPHTDIHMITRRRTANIRNQQQPQHVITIQSQIDWTAGNLKQLQRQDPIINKLIVHLENGTSPTNAEVAENTIYRIYFLNFESLVLENGILYRRFADAFNNTTHYQLVAPEPLRSEIVKRVHIQILCHAKTKSKNFKEIAKYAWWPEWRQTTENILSRCIPCCKTPQGWREPKVSTISDRVFADRPGQRLQFDLFTPTHPSGEYRYVLLCIDSFYSFIWLFPLKDRTARTTADCLIKIFTQHGVYRFCFSDSAPEYVSKTLKLVMAEYGIAHMHSLYYSSRINVKKNLPVCKLC